MIDIDAIIDASVEKAFSKPRSLPMEELEDIAKVLRDNLPDKTGCSQLGLFLFDQMKLKLSEKQQ